MLDIFFVHIFIHLRHIYIPHLKSQLKSCRGWRAWVRSVACRPPIHNGAGTRNLNSWDPGLGTTLHLHQSEATIVVTWPAGHQSQPAPRAPAPGLSWACSRGKYLNEHFLFWAAEGREAANWVIECAGGPVSWKCFALLSVTIQLIIRRCRAASYTVHWHSHAR